MKYTQIAAVAAFAGLANAQSQCASAVQSIPACALGFIASDAYYRYGCGIVDFGCQCQNFNSIVNDEGGDIGNSPVCANNLVDAYNGAMALCSCNSANSGAAPITLNAIQSQCEPAALQIPACGLGYVADAANSMFQCDVQDFACQCSNFEAISSAVAPDVSSACGTANASAVIASANQLCACVSGGGSGGSSSGPTSVSASATSGGSSAATSGASPSSSVPGVSAPTSVGSMSSIGATSIVPIGSGPGSVSGSSAVSHASGAGSASSHVTSAPVSRQSGGQSGTIPMPTFTGAGATVSAFGGVMALVGGLVALL